MPGERSERFLESTRGQVLTLIRQASRTVEELAELLGLTANAVRTHLATLERDGLVRQEGVRRAGGAGKPAMVFGLAPDADTRLSRAYAPVLVALVEELGASLPGAQAADILAAAGRRLAAAVPRQGGTLEARVRAAVALLNDLGGVASMERDRAGFTVRGAGCPLATAVSREPATCGAVQALLSELTGVEVRRECRYDPRPQCCFGIGGPIAR